MHLTRRTLLSLGCSMALAGATRAAPTPARLYQGRTIVTGMRAETRIPGMARTLAQVLVRVSGDPRLAANPALAALARDPEFAVKTYAYRDLYAFRPIRDEQGTRDRPYEMTVEYEPAAIDALLAELGTRPWLAERPRLVLFLAVRHIGSSFILTSTSDQGELMRESLKDAAWGAAMEVVIPSERTIAAAGVTLEALAAMPLAALLPFVDGKVGQVPLAGALGWSKELLAWKGAWRLGHGGEERRWNIAGVNFDAAFRNAVGGAAQILSGNGMP